MDEALAGGLGPDDDGRRRPGDDAGPFKEASNRIMIAVGEESAGTYTADSPWGR